MRFPTYVFSHPITSYWYLQKEKNTTFKTKLEAVDCPKEDYLGIVTFGQSNIANRVKRKKLIDHIDTNTFMYDWTSGKCFPYSEPLVGTDGKGRGNIFTKVIMKLRKKGYSKTLLVAPLARGGSSVFYWYRGSQRLRLDYFLKQANADNLNFDLFLWQQGETDAMPEPYVAFKGVAFGSDSRGQIDYYYSKALRGVFDIVRNSYPSAKFGVSITSICKNSGNGKITDAQFSVISESNEVFLSSNTDELDGSFRQDGCHFNENGEEIIASDYANLIVRLYP